MMPVTPVIGSVVRHHIQTKFLGYFSLLPVIANTTMAMPAIVVTAASTGRLARATITTTTRASSTSAVVTRACTSAATSVRTGILSVASRTDKSWRSEDLIVDRFLS